MSFPRRLGLLVLGGLAAGGFALYRLEQPYQGFHGETFVEFPRGTGTSGMADALAKAGVVPMPIRSGSCWRNALKCVRRIAGSEVQV